MKVLEFKKPEPCCDMILEGAMGRLNSCVIVGTTKDGDYWRSGSSDNIGEMCLLLNIALADFVRSAVGEE